jgi:hypothetical protein
MRSTAVGLIFAVLLVVVVEARAVEVRSLHPAIVRYVGTKRAAKLIPGLRVIMELIDIAAKSGKTTPAKGKGRALPAAQLCKLMVMSASAEYPLGIEHRAGFRLPGHLTARRDYQATGEFGVDLTRLSQKDIGYDKGRRVLYVVVPDVTLGPVAIDHRPTTYDIHRRYWIGEKTAKDAAEKDFNVKYDLKAEGRAQLLKQRSKARKEARKRIATLLQRFYRAVGLDIKVVVIVNYRDN